MKVKRSISLFFNILIFIILKNVFVYDFLLVFFLLFVCCIVDVKWMLVMDGDIKLWILLNWDVVDVLLLCFIVVVFLRWDKCGVEIFFMYIFLIEFKELEINLFFFWFSFMLFGVFFNNRDLFENFLLIIFGLMFLFNFFLLFFILL